jgi:S-adenosylmethionine/arginine decarboxylase-like enzyme
MRNESNVESISGKIDGGEKYGVELILDLHGCDAASFNRRSLDSFFEKLCDAIDMQKCERYFWDDVGVPEDERQTSPHTKGTSAVQFILTSSIVVHTLDLVGAVYVNIFSCKDFDPDIAKQITRDWFRAETCCAHFIERK